MSLKNSLDLFLKEDLFQALIVGTVVDNADPLKQGRCKISVPSFTEGIATDILPWAHQLFPVGTGTSSGIPSFKVPEVGTQVVCAFPDKNIYSMLYIGELIYNTHKLEELAQDYPETYGFIDKIKNKYWVNMAKKTADFHHVSGTHLNVAADGTITVTGVKDLNINIKGNANVNVTGQATITAAHLTINCDVTVNGKVVSTGDQIAGGISTMKHVHGGDSGGTTSPPK